MKPFLIGGGLIVALLFLVWLSDPLMFVPFAAFLALLLVGWGVVAIALGLWRRYFSWPSP